LQSLFAEIQEVYLSQPYPWVVGYSGGKDSTCALQLVWHAIAALAPEQRTRTVHVISTDTLVETPVIVNHVTGTLDKIKEGAIAQDMPFEVRMLRPETQDSFWVNLIGKGYPAPNSIFRWCTDRLKIKPSNKFIVEQVAENGEVILVLGVRQGESATRDQVINMHRVPGKKLARHGQLPGAWVFMPIEDFSVDDVWKFLLQTKSPWGGDNRQLANLYQSAQDGECPLVVDSSTSSCGNSRFGCWTCTVVSQDKSMQAVIENGEQWMTPLLEFRDWLADTQDPSKKPEQREYRGRDGRIRFSKGGSVLWRTYTLEFSKEILARLLETQNEVQRYDEEFELISTDELREIRRIWIEERGDWTDSLPVIHSSVTGKRLYWERDDVSAPGELEAQTLRRVAGEFDLPEGLMRELIDAEWQHYGMRRRAKIIDAIGGAFAKDWRSMEQAAQDELIRREEELVAEPIEEYALSDAGLKLVPRDIAGDGIAVSSSEGKPEIIMRIDWKTRKGK
jgi:DNA sulfur modification protein DndC